MKRMSVFIVLFAMFLTGCVSMPEPVQLSENFYTETSRTIGVAIENQQEPSFSIMGQVGLLDYAIISAATSDLDNHTKTLATDDFLTVGDDLVVSLKNSGQQAQLLEWKPVEAKALKKTGKKGQKGGTQFAEYNYAYVKNTANVDYLLLVKSTTKGFTRSYYGFVPTSDPAANFAVHGELIDLNTHQVLWRQTFSVNDAAQGEWDEPPTYPNLTNAYFSCLERAKTWLLAEFQRAPLQQAAVQQVVSP